MRPDILNPLFAEVTSLKGVGPGLLPLERLRIGRVVDVAFHLPTGHIDRFPRDELMMADAGRVISISLTVKEHRVSSSPRGPTRVRAEDAAGNSVALVYFGGNSGWVKKLLPIGETKIVSGRLDLYGQDLQIVHPDLGRARRISVSARPSIRCRRGSPRGGWGHWRGRRWSVRPNCPNGSSRG